MGYLSCNTIATCDPHYRHLKKKTTNKTIAHNNLQPVREFSYSQLLAATNHFSSDTFLGKGSYGTVYKATLDAGKLIAAVKLTKIHHAAADNEIEILSRVPNPRRFVNLIGFCTNNNKNDNKLIVVEYMPNGSLYDLLHLNPVHPAWTRRVRFAIQVAKAVHALHSAEPPVIHRDIKSSNILIDDKWNARLADFGLALRGHVEDARVKCTPPAGTLGYLDPCYLAPADLTAKSDVFSFGILLLEIISGRNPIDFRHSPPSVLDWAVPLIKSGDFARICDPRIGVPPDMVALRQFSEIAARCVMSTAEKRPAMSEVVECLKIVRKRIHAPAIWSSIKWRVEARGKPLGYECDRSEDVMRVVKGGNRRNGKVSNVSSLEYDSEPAKNRTLRSRSIGSGFLTEINVKSGSDPHQIGSRFGIRKGKMGATRLNRSRSMGFLQSARVLHHGIENPKRFHQKQKDNIDQIPSTEKALSKLVILDKKLELKIQEKPFVKSHGVENPSD